MFKIEYERNGRTVDYNFNFQILWVAELKARDICNILHTNVHIYDIHNHVYVAHYWAD